MKIKVTNGKQSRQKGEGLWSDEFGAGGERWILRISVNWGSKDKRNPRKHIDTVIKREVTSALELRAETTFLLVPLPDHKKKKRKKE